MLRLRRSSEDLLEGSYSSRVLPPWRLLDSIWAGRMREQVDMEFVLLIDFNDVFVTPASAGQGGFLYIK